MDENDAKNAADILADLHALGLSIQADGERFRVTPSGRLTPAQREALIANRQAVLALLDSPLHCRYCHARLTLALDLAFGFHTRPCTPITWVTVAR